SKALIEAEKHEPGFAWKFAAYMRDPKKGKGNRIQGTIAPAILSTTFPASPFTQEYVYKCLRHRADDLVIFVCHFTNLGLGEIPESCKKGIARAANEMDEYQLLKYAKRQYKIERLRKGCKRSKRASLRLVDALGLVKKYLNPQKYAIYRYLHAPTRRKNDYVQELELAPYRRQFFKSGRYEDALKGRLTLEQVLSFKRSNPMTWHNLLEMTDLLSDIAFKNHIRCMYTSGVSLNRIKLETSKRSFQGVWPHQIYAGYRAAMEGSVRLKNINTPGSIRRAEERYRSHPCPMLLSVFDQILDRVTRACLPPGLNLGIADISSSMFSVGLTGECSSIMAGDVAVMFSALMSKDLGYAATFGSQLQILERGSRSNLEFADHIRHKGTGWGGTQIAGSVVALIAILLQNRHLARPRTLFFFSDMQFHPPELELSLHANIFPEEIRDFFDFRKPPLESAIESYRHFLG
ncbi:MAG: hypothetical protein K8F91_24195, partial [Candidatus Obscuribacterales bacterium]|nr:hypothetical protein [Candidatus Obscuribacterales bacterium]